MKSKKRPQKTDDSASEGGELEKGIFSDDKLILEAVVDSMDDITDGDAAEDPNAHGTDQDKVTDLGVEVAVEDDGDESKQLSGRYFDDKDSGPTCHNCGNAGHIARECGQPGIQPCFLCGQLGHSRSLCPQDLCYNCLHPGHQSRDCPQPKRRRFIGDNEVCNGCGLPGHLQRDCSLQWRQYLFCKKLNRGTFARDLNVLKQACYNCASEEHFGDECPDRRRAVNYSIFHRPLFDYLELTAYKYDTRPQGHQGHAAVNHVQRHQQQAHVAPNVKKSRSPSRLSRGANSTAGNMTRGFSNSANSSYGNSTRGGFNTVTRGASSSNTNTTDANTRGSQNRPLYRGGYQHHKPHSTPNTGTNK